MILKGLLESDVEDFFIVVCCEFEEEMGLGVGEVDFLDFGEVRFGSGKWVCVWVFEGDCDFEVFESNIFEIEWLLCLGCWQKFFEFDCFVFFGFEEVFE